MSWHVGCSFSRRVTCLLALNGKVEIENAVGLSQVPLSALCPSLPSFDPAAAQTLIMHLEGADF